MHGDLFNLIEAKMISRRDGRSAVDVAAYLNCSRMLNEDMKRQAVRRMVGQAQKEQNF